jgi:hypothetical protein
MIKKISRTLLLIALTCLLGKQISSLCNKHSDLQKSYEPPKGGGAVKVITQRDALQSKHCKKPLSTIIDKFIWFFLAKG